MEAMTRTCPGCKGRGGRPGDKCPRCVGEGKVPDLGGCCMVSFASEVCELAGRHCDRPADLVYDGLARCDSHALARAVELGEGCPSCSGEITSGMHRGEVVGVGLVRTCSTTAAHAALQTASERAAAALYSTGAVTDLGDDDVDHDAEAEEFSDADWEEAEGFELGEGAPTLDEMNPTINDRGRWPE